MNFKLNFKSTKFFLNNKGFFNKTLRFKHEHIKKLRTPILRF